MRKILTLINKSKRDKIFIRGIRPIIKKHPATYKESSFNMGTAFNFKVFFYPSLNQWNWLCRTQPIPDCDYTLIKQKKIYIFEWRKKYRNNFLILWNITQVRNRWFRNKWIEFPLKICNHLILFWEKLDILPILFHFPYSEEFWVYFWYCHRLDQKYNSIF